MRLDLEKKGINWAISFFVLVFVLQWLMLWLGSVLPIYDIIMYKDTKISYFEYVSVGVSVIGLFINAVADRQLHSYIQQSKQGKKPQDTFCKRGLWKYSRHPNYVGQAMYFIGLSMWAYSVNGSWVSILGPYNIILLLVAYALPIMEKRMLAKEERRKDYQQYIKDTPAMIFF